MGTHPHCNVYNAPMRRFGFVLGISVCFFVLVGGIGNIIPKCGIGYGLYWVI